MESTTDILEKLIEEEQKIRQKAEELGLRVGKGPPEEVKKPFRAKEGIPRTELTEREMARLLAETRDILDIYNTDYVAEHFDEANNLYHSLKDKPFSPDSLIGSRIVQNIQELKERIDAVGEQESPTKPLEELLSDAKRVLDSLDSLDSIQAKRRYADLLKRQQEMPRNVDEPLEVEIDEYLVEIGKRIQRSEKKTSEEIGEELLEEISTLIGSGTFNPDGYNRIAKKFQEIADDLPEDLKLKIRDRIRESYAKMKDLEQKEHVEERVREVRAKKFYWDSFAQEVEQLKADLERASPGEFFRLYDIYDQLLDSLEHADLSDVHAAQIDRVKSMVDQCYYMLEELRSRA
ncbi:MAG: hypothetical protein HXS41_11365 [Theionarchaea archaeon]|nr:hypothetical protein [Theionarchaea archaeon]MBU7000056.1 hypothetical protein [Theionarchaea archaeon]MBU7021646.1 hypothetical protein [Theionarchaea archaeon]MBU7034706.1 hypothetical protein [Theionarchaea archaeon]MBU7039367.1 hypothetical protein [Theionarchaea archaeon]